MRHFDLQAVRADFPLLKQLVNGKRLVYLDNGATTQKPQQVLDAINNFYVTTNSNVHRGAHSLSDQATEQFEAARQTVQHFINAERYEEIIWTKGTTESLNLLAATLGGSVVSAGDEVIVSTLEHHANIVPWQLLCQRVGAHLKVIPLLSNGDLDLDAFENLLSSKTKIVSVAHVSNALGTVNPVADIIDKAKQVGAYTIIDGAQAVGHFPVDVQALGCDFYAMSAHKAFGPTGLGVLYGRYDLLAELPPYQSGGEMIETVSFEGSTFQLPPFRFEAGTPDIAGAIAMAAGIEYITQFERSEVMQHEDSVLAYAHERALSVEGLRVVGMADKKTSVFSFLIEGAHPHDIGTLLDQQGVAVRTGNHCTQPLMGALGINGTVRASFALYNGIDDVDALFDAINKAKEFL